MPHKKEALNFMDKLKLKSQFNGRTTKIIIISTRSYMGKCPWK
jgi:hypothetical protein